MATGGKVPHFSLRPHPGVTITLVLVVIAGILIALSFFSMEDGAGKYRHRGILTLTITLILSICLTMVATAKMWFSHLWKKNSSHSRHRRHTKFHPAMRDREFREHQR
jgi:hypothetical protein